VIKIKVAFLEDQLLFSQPEQSKKFSKSSDLLKKKPALQKSHFCFDHVNGLIILLTFMIWRVQMSHFVVLCIKVMSYLVISNFKRRFIVVMFQSKKKVITQLFLCSDNLR